MTVLGVINAIECYWLGSSGDRHWCRRKILGHVYRVHTWGRKEGLRSGQMEKLGCGTDPLWEALKPRCSFRIVHTRPSGKPKTHTRHWCGMPRVTTWPRARWFWEQRQFPRSPAAGCSPPGLQHSQQLRNKLFSLEEEIWVAHHSQEVGSRSQFPSSGKGPHSQGRPPPTSNWANNLNHWTQA